MAFWWVNHKQTVRQEVGGGYLWSPKQNSDGRRNATYDNMLAASPGDVVFSYANQAIGAIGTVRSTAMSSPKPVEFGGTGANWAAEGWYLPVDFEPLSQSLRPKQYIEQIAPLLPQRHSPIRASGEGNQGVYLASISESLGNLLLALSGFVPDRSASAEADIRRLNSDETLTTTERDQLTKARVGQGLFRLRVLEREPRCRVTGVAVARLLRASHIKPWRISTTSERLDGNNGLMLAPHVDVLFDYGLISFQDDGRMIVSPALPADVLQRWHLAADCQVEAFRPEQTAYLAFHRASVFQAA